MITVAEIETAIGQLPPEDQRRLVESLTQHLHLTPAKSGWESELAAMASDPATQKKLHDIHREFTAAKADGLGQA